MLVETHVEATVVGGGLQLDEPLKLPDSLRVRVAIVSPDDQAVPDDLRRERSTAAWQRIRERSRRVPIVSGERFTRDELHDRR